VVHKLIYAYILHPDFMS